MNKYCILILFLFNLFFLKISALPPSEATILSGTVTDKKSGEPLVHATVYFPDLRTGTVTNFNGNYHFNNLPKGKFLIQIRFIGYKTLNEIIDLNKVNEKNFALEPSAIEESEVTITGTTISSTDVQNTVSIAALDRKSLLSQPSTNIIGSLSAIPGVNQVSTGPAISKPVIRGLGYNRIITLYEGTRQEGQQWGDEHGIEIDEFSADKVEILRGPASLLYGSDAIGGIINILEAPAAPDGTLRGEYATKFFTNGKYTGNSLMLEGARNGYSARMRGSFKSSASYSTPVEKVYNSAFSEMDLNGMFGVNKGWGYSHLNFSIYHTRLGLIEGERDSLSDKFIDTGGNIVSEKELNSRTVHLPLQEINHYRITSRNRFILRAGQLAVIAGAQANDRREFVSSVNSPDFHLLLHTGTLDVKYYFPEFRKTEIITGYSGILQNNFNQGNEYLIPDNRTYENGAFLFARRLFSGFTLNAGIRYDQRTITTRTENDVFSPFKTNFNAFTGSAGASVKLDTSLNLKLNFGRSFRTPNIQELSANGIHEGNFRYERGNSALKPETTLQGDASLIFQNKKLKAELNYFCTLIENYIYFRHFNDSIQLLDYQYPIYYAVQGKSLLQGGEFNLDYHIIEQLHFASGISMSYGTNLQTNIPLPLIPPVKIRNEIKYKISYLKISRESYLSVIMDGVFKQNRTDIFETSTAGYIIYGFAAGTTIKVKNSEISIQLGVNNIFNTRYYDHLNRLKYIGIYNTGRNITLNVVIPFNLQKK